MTDLSIPARAVDVHALPVMLTTLRLPSFHRHWPALAERADKEGWPAASFLAALAELEIAERETRRIRRHLLESRLPGGKTLATFDFVAIPGVPRARVEALAAGDWIETGANLIVIGNSGAGKTHVLCAIGHALVEAGRRVLYTRTTDLVQKLQAERRDLALEAALAKLDRFDLIILDDISYARKDQAETSVLFELIARRYETRSLAIAANQPFSAWDSVFPDQAVTVAAIDRLVHHATILEMNTESYRRRTAIDRGAAMVDRATTTITDNLDDNRQAVADSREEAPHRSHPPRSAPANLVAGDRTSRLTIYTEAASQPADLPGAPVTDRQGRVEAAGREPQRHRAPDPGRSRRPCRLLPVLWPLGRGRAQARRDPGPPEDTSRLHNAIAVARHRQQAARAHGEVHGGDRTDAVGAQPARDPDARRAEAVGLSPRPRGADCHAVGVRLSAALTG